MLFGVLLSFVLLFLPVLTLASNTKADAGRQEEKQEQWSDEKYELKKHLCPRETVSTSLVASVIREDEFEVRCWLDKAKVRLNEFNEDGWNPLLWTAASNQLTIAELLLQAGANVNAENEAGDTPLSLAVHVGNVHMLKLLLRFDPNPEPKMKISSSSPLAIAAMNGHVSIVQILVDAHADVNSKNSLGRTPLMHAALGGHKNIVSILIKRGAYVNLQDENKFSALMIAASKGYEEIANILINKGANINLQDHTGKTALIWSVIGNHHNISKALLQDCFDDTVMFKRVCANHKIRDKEKRSALSYAVMYSNTVMGPKLTELRDIDEKRENSNLR